MSDARFEWVGTDEQAAELAAEIAAHKGKIQLVPRTAIKLSLSWLRLICGCILCVIVYCGLRLMLGMPLTGLQCVVGAITSVVLYHVALWFMRAVARRRGRGAQ